MGRKDEIVERVRGIAAPLAAGEGLELVDVELAGGGGRTTLRLFIDRPGAGVSLDDCSEVSRAVSAALDVEDPIAGAYELEVSSPGLDRPLRTPEHFAKYAGQKTRVKTYGPLPECGGRKTFVGLLQGYEDGKVVIDVDGTVYRVPHDQVAKANLEPALDGVEDGGGDAPEAVLSVDGAEVETRSVSQLRRALSQARSSPFVELTVHRDDGSWLTALLHGDHAFLAQADDGEEPRHTSRNPGYTGDAEATIEFRYAGEEPSLIPAAATVGAEQALRAVEHYYLRGKRASFIAWEEHETSADEEDPEADDDASDEGAPEESS